jgi:hypothetical protein
MCKGTQHFLLLLSHQLFLSLSSSTERRWESELKVEDTYRIGTELFPNPYSISTSIKNLSRLP